MDKDNQNIEKRLNSERMAETDESFREKEIMTHKGRENLTEKAPEKEEEKVESEEKKLAPAIEKLKSSISKTAPTTPTLVGQKALTKEEEEIVESLVSITIKNPDIEKGIDEASKLLNEKIKLLCREGKDPSYVIDEYHDRLVREIRNREQKLQ